jgi:hypothetical protein
MRRGRNRNRGEERKEQITKEGIKVQNSGEERKAVMKVRKGGKAIQMRRGMNRKTDKKRKEQEFR